MVSTLHGRVSYVHGRSLFSLTLVCVRFVLLVGSTSGVFRNRDFASVRTTTTVFGFSVTGLGTVFALLLEFARPNKHRRYSSAGDLKFSTVRVNLRSTLAHTLTY